VDNRLAAIQDMRQRLVARRLDLTKAVANARMRCAAVIMDAVATVERCQDAQRRRAAHRTINPRHIAPAHADEDRTP
jgi:hypothetical protein